LLTLELPSSKFGNFLVILSLPGYFLTLRLFPVVLVTFRLQTPRLVISPVAFGFQTATSRYDSRNLSTSSCLKQPASYSFSHSTSASLFMQPATCHGHSSTLPTGYPLSTQLATPSPTPLRLAPSLALSAAQTAGEKLLTSSIQLLLMCCSHLL